MSDGPTGEIRVHHVLPGLWILDARACVHRWVVFHETYSFCLVRNLSPPSFAEWKYNGRLYAASPERPVMMMQPGEVHANLQRTPAADFIVVQAQEHLVSRIAEELGRTRSQLNIEHPHPSSDDPAVITALNRFQRLLCHSLFSGLSSHCSCAASSERFYEALAELVAAVFRIFAEDSPPGRLTRPRSAPVERALRFLRSNASQAYDLEQLERAAGCGRHYLLHLFRREVGAPPSEIHSRILVSRVCQELVSSPQAPLDEIAHKVGWPGGGTDPTRARKATLMIRHFRRVLGMTPGQFRTDLRRATGSPNDRHGSGRQRRRQDRPL